VNIRERLEQEEHQLLAPQAQRSAESRGRPRPEPEDELRTCYQHDRDRILHCKSFRRLAGKTQVFLAPEGDHYRTRITHTLEVAQIARTITRALRLNETLVEACCLGHDLGHTPFGHAGETVLARLLPDGFHHVRQSLRVVDVLEKDGRGLNLTHEVREGILKHSKGKGPILGGGGDRAQTLEGQIVRLADIIGYVNHDLDDAVRGGVVREDELPATVNQAFGTTHRERIRSMVLDVVEATSATGLTAIAMSPERLAALVELRGFMYERVYENPVVHGELVKAEKVLTELWEHFHADEDEFRTRYWPRGVPQTEPLWRGVADFLAGMTDRYAVRLYEDLFVPRPWGRW
jgi:dGTPase